MARTILMLLLASPLALLPSCNAQAKGTAEPGERPQSFCNPLDLPYRFTLSGKQNGSAVSRREAADPVIVQRDGIFWLFASKSGGYWHSRDLAHWEFVVPKGFPSEEYAPTVEVVNDQWYLATSGGGTLYSTGSPASGVWREAGPVVPFNDPDLFQDEDGKVYEYSGSSPDQPIFGVELDPADKFKMIGEPVALIPKLDPIHHGWEARDPLGSDEQILQEIHPPWMEAAWMTRHKGTYYLQYSAPATEMREYADGVYTSDRPLGPFKFEGYSPFSQKTSGFAGSAGHSSTFQDTAGRYWHVSTMVVAVRHSFERRLGIFPAGFLPNAAEPDQLATNTYLGDYPQYVPGIAKDPLQDNLTGWMLLDLKKHARASSTLDAKHSADLAFDEDIRTWWAAATGKPGEWLSVDMGRPVRIDALQINFADEQSTFHGRLDDAYKYTVEISEDETHWRPLVDRSANQRDAPHEYIQLDQPVKARYARITNVHTPAGAVFSISGLRLFGSGLQKAPSPVRSSTATRLGNLRVMHIAWQPSKGAEFYIVRYGVRPDRLTQNFQVYGASEADLPGLNTGQSYFYTVDAVNDSGITRGAAAHPVPSGRFSPGT